MNKNISKYLSKPSKLNKFEIYKKQTQSNIKVIDDIDDYNWNLG
jgi:hypothetical protein